MYNTNTQAHKIQLKQKLHNLKKNKMNINEYFTKVKNLTDVLTFMEAQIGKVSLSMQDEQTKYLKDVLHV
jgi:hypothetical protein